MLQYYYTSTKQGREGYVGFQCKAMSPGLTPEDISIIKSMITYQIPYGMDVHAIDTHPVAFRYKYPGGDSCYLVCSQSNGKDENGRPGNFFSHAVKTSVRDFDTYHPIMYWKHPFWKRNDPSGARDIPPEPYFTPRDNPSLLFDDIFQFLERGNRRAWLYKLVSALINYDDLERPIVLLDTTEHIAYWIAAMAIAMPGTLRKYLTFTTYTHQPYQAAYKIIGTSKEVGFRCTEDEYISYFILNAFDRRISETPDSSAARYICDNLYPDKYVTKLIDFFDICERRLPLERTQKHLALKLNSVADMHRSLREKDMDLKSAKVSVRVFQSMTGPWSDEDTRDLRTLADYLRNNFRRQPTLQNLNDYRNALNLIRKHDARYLERFEQDFETLSQIFHKATDAIISNYVEMMIQIYSQERWIQYLSSQKLQIIAKKLLNQKLDVHLRIWRHLLPYVRINYQTRPIISDIFRQGLDSVERVETSGRITPSEQSRALLSRMVEVLHNNEEMIIDNLIDWAGRSRSKNYRYLYYILVQDVPLDKRQPYRNRLKSIDSGLVYYELERELGLARYQDFLSLLDKWLDYARRAKISQTGILNYGLRFVWPRLNHQQRFDIARELLHNSKYRTYITGQWQRELLVTFFERQPFAAANQYDEDLYEHYYHNPDLPTEVRAKLGAALAMKRGTFPAQLPEEIREYLLNKVDQSKYKQAVETLFSHFFSHRTTETHAALMRATYVEKYSNVFFETYWANLLSLFRRPEKAFVVAEILSFWFEQSAGKLADIHYLPQLFFLYLPDFFALVHNDREAKRHLRRVSTQASQKPWYKYVSIHLEKKRGWFIIG